MKHFILCYKLQKDDRDVETYLVSDLDISATDEKVDIVWTISASGSRYDQAPKQVVVPDN